ncbi:MAG: flippase-like domain-containing protein [Pirellulales bacterium]|nr:flippase-like domain-containing protein [Pirellulales bacterium]
MVQDRKTESKGKRIAKKALLLLVKIGIPIAIITYLVYEAKNQQSFAELYAHPKNWPLLTAACLCCASAVLLTIVRWYFLVRALDVPCGLREVLRIGFMGYLFNLAPMGIIGGDVLKAVLLGRHYKGSQAKAFASVIVDRLMGLYMLFVVATVAILATGFLHFDHPQIRFICQLAIIVTVVSTIGIMALWILAAANGRLSVFLKKQPVVGEPLERLVTATAMYRHKPLVLTAGAIMSIGVHSLFTVGIFLIAIGLFGNLLPEVLSLKAHFVISPLSAATGAIPLCMGPFEYVISHLYQWVGGSSNALAQGLVVALGYRIVTVLIAAVGLVYYFGARREVAEAMHADTHEQDPPNDKSSGQKPGDKPPSDKASTIIAA